MADYASRHLVKRGTSAALYTPTVADSRPSGLSSSPSGGDATECKVGPFRKLGDFEDLQTLKMAMHDAARGIKKEREEQSSSFPQS